jgi:hypothetical protein
MICLVMEACKGGLVGQGLLSFQPLSIPTGIQRFRMTIFHDTQRISDLLAV